MQGMGSDQRFWDLLTRDEQDALAAMGRDRKYPPGATLCVQGDPATHVFVLVDGWVKILSVTDDGREHVLALRGDGDIVGETAGETTGQRNATMKAIGNVHALIVGYDRFSSFLDSHPGADHAHRRVMTRRWNDADTMLRRRTVTSGSQRLAGLLLDLAGPHGSGADDDAIEVALPLSQEELASLVDASRATVTRALRNWRSRGFIRTGQRRITITDLSGLRQAAGPVIRNLHAAELEVLLDVVFNHTAEGDHLGPHLCFRGIDNRAYYRLDRDQSRYKDYSGCGNSLNMRHPQVLALIMDSLRYWIDEMHVDGFHFDLASALAHNLYEAGYLSTFFDLIRKDPVISQVKLIAESWDLGEDGGYQVDNFPRLWAEFNDNYRDAVCRFWRGAPQPPEELARRLTGSVDLCRSDGRSPGTSINFITHHDGFTLHDLVSYNDKHNEANGEDNRDGIEFNNSWNCGVEGPTGDREVQDLRERQKRNFLTTLFLSAGVPTLLAGDERGRTQQGNNNPYCQDNEISWVDWKPGERGDALVQFTKELIKLRAAHRIFRRRKPFEGHEIGNTGTKDIGWFSPDGAELHKTKWHNRNIHALGMFLNGQAVFDRALQSERIGDDSFLLLFNGSFETIWFTLPGPSRAASYLPIVDTSNPRAGATDTAAACPVKAGDVIRLEAWSMVVLIKTR
jgi:glycogen debranching enzyme GlgX